MSFYECQDRCRQFWPLLRNAISSLLLLTLETASVHMWMCQDADVNLPTLPENGKQEHDVSIYLYTVYSSCCVPFLRMYSHVETHGNSGFTSQRWRYCSCMAGNLEDILSWCMYLWEGLGANLGIGRWMETWMLAILSHKGDIPLDRKRDQSNQGIFELYEQPWSMVGSTPIASKRPGTLQQHVVVVWGPIIRVSRFISHIEPRRLPVGTLRWSTCSTTYFACSLRFDLINALQLRVPELADICSDICVYSHRRYYMLLCDVLWWQKDRHL